VAARGTPRLNEFQNSTSGGGRQRRPAEGNAGKGSISSRQIRRAGSFARSHRVVAARETGAIL
jgi:hypothetical protein